jgi:hypothetical protein
VSLSSKVKTALDETRTLMLGAQILLGFQFHGAFQQRFDALSSQVRIIARAVKCSQLKHQLARALKPARAAAYLS